MKIVNQDYRVLNGATSFEISDRTGVGADDFQQKPNEAVSIFGVSVAPKVLVYQGKIKKYFYDQPQDRRTWLVAISAPVLATTKVWITTALI